MDGENQQGEEIAAGWCPEVGDKVWIGEIAGRKVSAPKYTVTACEVLEVAEGQAEVEARVQPLVLMRGPRGGQHGVPLEHVRPTREGALERLALLAGAEAATWDDFAMRLRRAAGMAQPLPGTQLNLEEEWGPGERPTGRRPGERLTVAERATEGLAWVIGKVWDVADRVAR